MGGLELIFPRIAGLGPLLLVGIGCSEVLPQTLPNKSRPPPCQLRFRLPSGNPPSVQRLNAHRGRLLTRRFAGLVDLMLAQILRPPPCGSAPVQSLDARGCLFLARCPAGQSRLTPPELHLEPPPCNSASVQGLDACGSLVLARRPAGRNGIALWAPCPEPPPCGGAPVQGLDAGGGCVLVQSRGPAGLRSRRPALPGLTRCCTLDWA
mmetsp:Transcript_41291/g.128693  ORF Transcript_41291/g.128693 Transcript_41291/m.128693 type:complete len:208 (-) Transcript_41291:188-811(-)